MPERVRSVALPIVLLAGLLVFGRTITEHRAFADWLVWRYLVCWVVTCCFVACSAAAGLAIVRRVRGAEVDAVALALSFPAGLAAFQLLWFLVGLARGYGAVAFFAVPLGLAVIGRGSVAAARTFFAERERTPWSAVDVACTAIGALGLVVLALPVLVPENVSYDARWYHLALAEHNAAAAGLEPLPEAFVAGGYPQLATLLYTWAFVEPGGAPFDHVELAAHLELAATVWTIVSIPLLVRALLPDAPLRRVWPVFFLFPGVFLYDSGPACGADHVAALFAVPIFLTLLEAWAKPTRATFALAGAFLGAAVATKYTTVVLVAFPALTLVTRALVGAFTALRRGAYREAASALEVLLAAALAGVLVTSSFWARNWLFYGDPIYPMLARALGGHPWGPHADAWYARFVAIRHIPGSEPPNDILGTLAALVTFSVKPHDWPTFHGEIPVFGSLFTVATAALVFVRASRRTWAVVLASYVALAVWVHMAPQDRYIQMFLPWMVAATATAGVLAWRTGLAARVAVGLLVAVQALWGATVYGTPAHAMTARNPLSLLGDHLAVWQRGATPELLHPFPPFRDVASELPRGAKVLVHETNTHLGLGVRSVNDCLPYQYGLDYAAAGDAAGVHAALVAMGVTHVLWKAESAGSDSLAGDLAFYSYVGVFGERARARGDMILADVPRTAPPRWPASGVLVVACGPDADLAGLYSLADMHAPIVGAEPVVIPAAPHRALATADLEQVGYVVRDPACRPPEAVQRLALTVVGKRGRYQLSVRTAPAPPGAP